jgi:hypothetical protein
MVIIQLNLKYKGSRTYLHGSDIYNAIVEELSGRLGGYPARLVFKHFARNQVELLLESPESTANVIGSGLWRMADENIERFWIRETDAPVTDSYPFEEDAITSTAHIEGQSIRAGHTNPYTVIENIIALTKKLNYALSPDVNGKWLFGQIDLKQALPAEWDSIQIERTICVGTSFSRNRIVVDETDCGEIRFIGGEP